MQLPAGNGYVETRTYDRAGRLTEVKHQRGTAVLSRFSYTLDRVGDRTAIATTSGTTTFTYDELDRLTLACYTSACTGPGDNFRRYTYDPLGNRLAEVRDTGTTTYTYNAADELLSTAGPGGAVSYAHDLDGRMAAAGSRTFSWALPARLARTTSGNTTFSYTYDGDGLGSVANVTSASGATRWTYTYPRSASSGGRRRVARPARTS